MFIYLEGTSYNTYALTNFRPLFVDKVLYESNATQIQRDAAFALCGTNKECLFDLIVTGTLLSLIVV